MLCVVCVKQGSAYSADHANILRDMVLRNLPASMPHRFVCLTDHPEGLDPEIEVVALPPDVEGWWAKLALFRRGVFREGDLFTPAERVIYFDLDIVITGHIEQALGYAGPFATLRDFYRPAGLQSAVMMWEAGWGHHIWDAWEDAGRPHLPGGDQEWIERMVPESAILQDHFPDQFVSYKVHCRTVGKPPRGARFVKFHGKPKPEHCPEEWVRETYKKGGGNADDIRLMCNASDDELYDNIRVNMQRDIPWVGIQPINGVTAVLVGGGPSLKHTGWQIAKRQEAGQKIFALNGAADWLAELGVTPDYHVVLDARQQNARFVRGLVAKCYLLASQCHPDVFDAVVGKAKVAAWHYYLDDIATMLPENDKPVAFHAAGVTVGLNAMSLAHAMGYRDIHLFGFDSSLADCEHHVYSQKLDQGEEVVEVKANGRTFLSTHWMTAQVNQFQRIASDLANAGAEISVHGDGLLRHVAYAMSSVEVDGQFKKINDFWWPAADIEAASSVIGGIGDIDEILRFVPTKRVAVQAGGNVGVWPSRLSSLFHSVYTFEPDADNYACLQKNVVQENVYAFNAALGADRGRVSLTKDPKNVGAHYVREGGDVKVMKVDDLHLSSLDLICLDIEGYEMEALKGARQSIARHKPTIALEDKGLSERYGTQQGEAAEWLASEFGYRVVARCGNDVILRHGV